MPTARKANRRERGRQTTSTLFARTSSAHRRQEEQTSSAQHAAITLPYHGFRPLCSIHAAADDTAVATREAKALVRAVGACAAVRAATTAGTLCLPQSPNHAQTGAPPGCFAGL